jgi:ABC-type glycerol-3-phosphate transport system substrate-binding protein
MEASVDRPVYNPLYLQVREILLKRIVDGVYPRGAALPSESRLAAEFHTSVSTVRQALSTLVAEGVLNKRQGKGTFIADQTLELTFLSWMGETPQGDEILRELLSAFERKYPAMSVRIIPTTYYETRRELLRMISAGDAPDVAQIVTHWTSMFSSMGAFAPLEGLLSPENLQDRLEAPDLLAGTVQNHVYSVSWGLCPMALIAHKGVIRDAGLSLPDSAMSLDEFCAMCRRISDYYGGHKYAYALCISGDETDFLRIYTFLQAFGGGLVDGNSELRFDRSENVAGFEWLRQLVQSASVFINDIYIIRKRFADGDIAFISDGPWIRYLLEELTGEEFEQNFQVVLNPTHANGVSYSWNYNHALAILAQSKKQVYAAKLVDAITGDPDICTQYHRKIGMLPVSKTCLQAEIYDTAYYRTYRRQLGNIVPIEAENPLFEKAMVLCIDAVKKILFEGADIRKELDEKQYYLKMLYYG